MSADNSMEDARAFFADSSKPQDLQVHKRNIVTCTRMGTSLHSSTRVAPRRIDAPADWHQYMYRRSHVTTLVRYYCDTSIPLAVVLRSDGTRKCWHVGPLHEFPDSRAKQSCCCFLLWWRGEHCMLHAPHRTLNQPPLLKHPFTLLIIALLFVLESKPKQQHTKTLILKNTGGYLKTLLGAEGGGIPPLPLHPPPEVVCSSHRLPRIFLACPRAFLAHSHPPRPSSHRPARPWRRSSPRNACPGGPWCVSPRGVRPSRWRPTRCAPSITSAPADAGPSRQSEFFLFLVHCLCICSSNMSRAC